MKRAILALALACALTSTVHAQTAKGPKFVAFAFTNDDHGWAAGSDGIDVTQDGGRSWQPQYRGRRVDELVIVRRRSVYALADGAVLHPVNDGAVWEIAGRPQPALEHLAFTSERDGFAIGSDGLLYASEDGAKSWHRAPFDRPLSALCFSDRRTGFAGGALSAPALGAFDGIAVTHDGGRTWAESTRPPSDGLVGIAGHLLHCTRGSVYDLVDLGPHAGGGAYVLARSTDSGRSWKPIVIGGQAAPLRDVPRGPGTEATSMSAFSPAAAYVAGFCGACGATGQSSFGSTVDGGRSWHNVTLDAVGFTSAPVFTSARRGWIGARVFAKGAWAADEILRTDNAGRTWTIVYNAPSVLIEVRRRQRSRSVLPDR
jgi:photosystem II stability/assembly factor-like uncharacterized protein